MLGLLSAIREFSPDRNVAFRTYAELCIRRRMISAIRQAAGNKHTPLNTYVSLELTLFVGNQEYSSFGAAMGRQENPEDMIISRERLRSLVKWINDQLTELERSILQYYLKGFSYAEIAKEVDRSTKSVDNAVQRIRRKIARQIQSSEYSES
jgi:RNA polymerase sporulation-specific sigma factor